MAAEAIECLSYALVETKESITNQEMSGGDGETFPVIRIHCRGLVKRSIDQLLTVLSFRHFAHRFSFIEGGATLSVSECLSGEKLHIQNEAAPFVSGIKYLPNQRRMEARAPDRREQT